MNGYTVLTYHGDKIVDQKVVDKIEEAREFLRVFVDDRMAAFGDDREALERYGYIEAQDHAEAMDEDGGTVFLQDGWKAEVIRNTDDN